MQRYTFLLPLMPLLFVILWSTGFIGAKLGLPYAEPLTFLTWRMFIAALLLLPLAFLTKAPWPQKGRQIIHIAVSGLLVHAIHLGGVFSGIHAGLPAGIAAVIMGLQPLLTATLVGRMLNEQVSLHQWLGLFLGLLGIVLVLGNRFTSGTVTGYGIGCVVVALFAMSFGTLYQKRFCANMDLRSGGVIQYAAAGLLTLLGAVAFESMNVTWSNEFIFAMGWLVVVLSVGAIGLLFTLIRQGAATRVASLFYLTPLFAVLFAFLLFGETLGVQELLGMLIVMAGVVLVNLPTRNPIR